jgi:hypothetical protein
MSGVNLGPGGFISKQKPVVPTIHTEKCVSSMFDLDEEAKIKICLPGRKLRTILQSMARNFTKLQLFLVDM